MKNKFSIIILAAGKGTRMNNPDIPKVLAELSGKPLIYYVLETSLKLDPNSIILIVGYQKEKVVAKVEQLNISNVHFIVQAEQLGTGHAVAQSKSSFDGNSESVLILSGDVPLLSSEALERFVQLHFENHSDLSVLSANTENPSGYGRIVRDEKGDFSKIVEHKDASKEQLQIEEINSGIYFVNSELLFDSLEKVKNNNAQAEYYLTDIVEIIKEAGSKVFAFQTASFKEIQGVNTNEQLMEIEKMCDTSLNK